MGDTDRKGFYHYRKCKPLQTGLPPRLGVCAKTAPNAQRREELLRAYNVEVDDMGKGPSWRYVNLLVPAVYLSPRGDDYKASRPLPGAHRQDLERDRQKNWVKRWKITQRPGLHGF